MSIEFASARELMDSLLEGHRLEPEELESIVAHIEEGQHLDYKDGRITSRQNRRQAIATIRQYVSGFTNADGGVLIVGVSDAPRIISPCERIGASLESWVNDILRDMVPVMAPPPRLQVIEHTAGPILIIAVARAPQLVSCTESRQAKPNFLSIGRCKYLWLKSLCLSAGSVDWLQGVAHRETSSRERALCCRLVGRASVSKAGEAGSFGWIRFLVRVARSLSSVWKLWTGWPSGVRRVAALRFALADGSAGATIDGLAASAASRSSSSKSIGASFWRMCHST
jgi:Putative DNA-binding domain